MPAATTTQQHNDLIFRDIEDYCPRCANKDTSNGKCTKCGFKVYWHV